MAKHCPVYGVTVLYLDCLDCDSKECKNGRARIESKSNGYATSKEKAGYDNQVGKEKVVEIQTELNKEVRMAKNKIVIGIDQSYQDTGISVAMNGQLKTIGHLYLKDKKNNSERRACLQKRLLEVFGSVDVLAKKHNASVKVVIERIRLQSQGFVNIDYIKSIGALNALICDTAGIYNFPVWSVDTRAWKSAIVGSSKPLKNKYGFNPEKWRTIKWCIAKGYGPKIKEHVSKLKKKAVIEKDGERFTFNDNTADSICICLYGFESNPLLKEEH